MTWDEYFYDLCNTVAKNSKCLSRHIGTVLVRDKSVISTGYNGPPRGVPHCGARYEIDYKLRGMLAKRGVLLTDEENYTRCPRQTAGFVSGEGLEWCIAGHGERNALINAARNGIYTLGTTLYMNCGIPCAPCLVEIINAGVEEIVVTKMQYYDVAAPYLVENSDLIVRVYEQFEGLEYGSY